MQRINWPPDPNTTGTAPIGVANAKVDYLIVNGRKWLRATSTGKGDVHAEYALSGSQLPPAGSYHVHANAYAQKAGALFIVFVRVNGSYQQPLNVPVGDGQTVTVDRTITIPAGCSQLIVRIGPNNQTVGAIGMMSDILIEHADTYDAVGGASGLLHGRHDAARIGASVGRVVSDDAHEPVYGAFEACDSLARLERDGQVLRSDHRTGLLRPVLRHGFRRHSEALRRRNRYDACLLEQRHRWTVRAGGGFDPFHQCDGRERFAESGNRGLHRLRGVRRHETGVGFAENHTLQRGHDAARLTLMGVMA